MCNIAGYVGNKRAAPILIDLLRRQQWYDGCVCTGIATIHEGKLYTAKVVGDVDTFLRETDGINFPGTIGIAHSRPGGDCAEHAHPFVDNSGKLAYVANGTFSCTNNDEYIEISRQLMHGYFNKGHNITSAIDGDPNSMFSLPNGKVYHGTDSYAHHMGELVDNGMNLCQAMAEAFSTRPNGFVGVAIHADDPTTIAIGKMNCPMTVGLKGDETYIATTQFGFPEDIEFDTVFATPVNTVCAATAGELKVTKYKINNLKVESITADIFNKAYDLTENYLKGKKDNPVNLWDLEKLYNSEWKPIWQEPYIDSKFANPDGPILKPYPELSYQVLWAMQKEGKLRKVLGERSGKYPMWHFYLD